MVEKNTYNVDYIQFEKLLEFPELQHAYILKTKNMDFRFGKDCCRVMDVENNLKKVTEALNLDYKNIIRPDFEHTNNVEAIDKFTISQFENVGKPLLNVDGRFLKDTDGLITDQTNAIIMATNADCNLILLYDPVKKVIGNIHAGWRGTFGKIAKNSIKKMKEKYGCDPKNIICCFCPSIRKCHFEVDEDVAKQCENIFEYTNRINEIIEKGDIKDGKQKYYIDTILINKILIEEEGVISKNIIDSGICSVCNSAKIHSRRAEGPNFGLACALISLVS